MVSEVKPNITIVCEVKLNITMFVGLNFALSYPNKLFNYHSRKSTILGKQVELSPRKILVSCAKTKPTLSRVFVRSPVNVLSKDPFNAIRKKIFDGLLPDPAQIHAIDTALRLTAASVYFAGRQLYLCA